MEFDDLQNLPGAGTNAEEGRKLLENANMITAETLADAAKKAVAAAKGN